MADDVNALYKSYLAAGKTPKDAAREAQQRTGMSLVTQQPIRQKGLSFSQGGVTYGQDVQLKKRPGSQAEQRVPSHFDIG